MLQRISNSNASRQRFKFHHRLPADSVSLLILAHDVGGRIVVGDVLHLS